MFKNIFFRFARVKFEDMVYYTTKTFLKLQIDLGMNLGDQILKHYYKHQEVDNSTHPYWSLYRHVLHAQLKKSAVCLHFFK